MVECELHQSQIKQCPLYRFNRYMVECEFKTWLHNTAGTGAVLIDTWWNVNQYVGNVRSSKRQF